MIVAICFASLKLYRLQTIDTKHHDIVNLKLGCLHTRIEICSVLIRNPWHPSGHCFCSIWALATLVGGGRIGVTGVRVALTMGQRAVKSATVTGTTHSFVVALGPMRPM